VSDDSLAALAHRATHTNGPTGSNPSIVTANGPSLPQAPPTGLVFDNNIRQFLQTAATAFQVAGVQGTNAGATASRQMRTTSDAVNVPPSATVPDEVGQVDGP
jgi:hypothetical protein